MGNEYPIRGELVLVNVERLTDHGAFVRLEEYGNKQGIVSLREFSPKWVKNPRDYLREGQKAVLKVLRVNTERGHIDLSLKEVNDNERRNKLKDFKLEVRVQKLMEHMSKAIGKTPDELDKLFAAKLVADYGTLYDAFSRVSNSTEDLKSYIPDAKLRESIIRFIRDNIKPTLVSVRGFIELYSEDSDGISVVKSALVAGGKVFPKGVEGTITYVSTPYYRIDVTTEDYKTAEKAMRDCYDAVEKDATSKGAFVAFSRELKRQAS
jgi:translation initiation factor 2 subunit 1